MQIKNFYVVKNHAIHDVKTYSFIRYCKRRDGDKAFYLYKSCTRKWMNQGDETRDQSGISILWPDTSNSFFNDALTECNSGSSFNNTSALIRYSLQDGASFLWLGDLENEFMDNIVDSIDLRSDEPPSALQSLM